MSTTAIIGCDTPLGQYWAGKRYFDCLINEENYSLLKGRQFGYVVVICPSLRARPSDVRADAGLFGQKVDRLITALDEAKIERMTYVTTLDLVADDGHEDMLVLPESEGSYLGELAKLNDYLNLKFGRVINLRLAELVGLEDNGPGWSVLAEFADCNGKKKKPKVGLLTKHQFYPVDRIVNDAELGWECGLSCVNLASEPLTSFELAEELYPKVVDSLPVAKESDPIGSNRTSKYAIYWNDHSRDYTIDKAWILERLKELV